jgi:hypothetical protein
MAALWTAFSTGVLTEENWMASRRAILPRRARGRRVSPANAANANRTIYRRLYKLSTDSDPSVKLAVATALRQFVSGSLTINTPPANPPLAQGLALVLASLVSQPGAGDDPLIPFMTWMALEPVVEKNARLSSRGSSAMASIIRK